MRLSVVMALLGAITLKAGRQEIADGKAAVDVDNSTTTKMHRTPDQEAATEVSVKTESSINKRRFYVHVYNYAHVADSVLARAEEEAARLFLQAGVQPIWVACPPSQGEIDRYPECHATRGLILNIRPEPGLKTAQRNHEFGFALNTTSYVFAGSLREIVQSGMASWPVVFGHVIAHEIGHILLGSNSHSPDGVMRASLGVEDWRRAAVGQLHFNASQRQTIRSFVAQAEPASVAP